MSSNTIGIVNMLEMLTHGCHSQQEIAEHTGLCKGTIIRYLKLLHKRGIVRIAEWHKDGSNRHWIMFWEWNPEHKKDAPKPKPKTRAEVQRGCKERKRLREAGLLAYAV